LSKTELLAELQRRAKALVQGVVSVMEEQHQLESRRSVPYQNSFSLFLKFDSTINLNNINIKGRY
jgi:hypothetical protein